MTIDLDSRVAPNPQVLCQELEGEAILLHLSKGFYYGLNPVGTVIWKRLQAGESLNNAASAVLERFEVDEENCRRDLIAFAEELLRKELVEVA